MKSAMLSNEPRFFILATVRAGGGVVHTPGHWCGGSQPMRWLHASQDNVPSGGEYDPPALFQSSKQVRTRSGGVVLLVLGA